MPIDIVQHLQNQNYSRAIQFRRVWWAICRPFFAASPNVCHAWRNLLLRLHGATIGQGVRIHSSVLIMFPWNLRIADHVVIGRGANLYALAPITIASHVLVSQGAHLCAGSHDYRQPNFPIAHRPIQIESGVWIAADAFLGPGVTIGAGAVVGARAVVTRNIPPGMLAIGNPARTAKPIARPL
jgi:putative colanic acid biosynthesis acetyltransferase WcaF